MLSIAAKAAEHLRFFYFKEHEYFYKQYVKVPIPSKTGLYLLKFIPVTIEGNGFHPANIPEK